MPRRRHGGNNIGGVRYAGADCKPSSIASRTGFSLPKYMPIQLEVSRSPKIVMFGRWLIPAAAYDRAHSRADNRCPLHDIDNSRYRYINSIAVWPGSYCRVGAVQSVRSSSYFLDWICLIRILHSISQQQVRIRIVWIIASLRRESLDEANKAQTLTGLRLILVDKEYALNDGQNAGHKLSGTGLCLRSGSGVFGDRRMPSSAQHASRPPSVPRAIHTLCVRSGRVQKKGGGSISTHMLYFVHFSGELEGRG